MPARGSGNVGQIMKQGNLIYGDDGTNFRPIKTDTSGNVQVDVLNTETIQANLLTLQLVAASTNVKSSALSVAGIKQALIIIDHARANSAAFGTNGTEYRVEVSAASSGNDQWRTIASVLANSAAIQAAIAASANVNAGGTTVVITSGTAITRGDILFWANTADLAGSSEWMWAILPSGTASFQILDGLTYDQKTSSSIWAGAQHFPFYLNLSAATRLRVVCNNEASGTTNPIYTRVACITEP